MDDEKLKNFEKVIASIEAYRSHLSEKNTELRLKEREKFESLFKEIKKYDGVSIFDHLDRNEVSIVVSKNARTIFWGYIVPDLPDGFFVKAEHEISDDKCNVFKIKKIEKKNVPKNKIHNHLSDILILLMEQRKCLSEKIPELAKIVAEESHNIASTEFKKRYDDYYYSDVGYISTFLCKISVELELIFKWEESLEDHLKDKYYKIKEREEALERKSKAVEEKEKELAERWRNLELLKEHLDKMLVTTN